VNRVKLVTNFAVGVALRATPTLFCHAGEVSDLPKKEVRSVQPFCRTFNLHSIFVVRTFQVRLSEVKSLALRFDIKVGC
jgi:hypothetical protein